MEQIPTPTALIIGGSGTIGEAICHQFAREGWHIGIHYRKRKAQAQEIRQHVEQAGGTGSLYQADIRDFQQVHHSIRTFHADCGRIDVLIYAVGTTANQLVLRTSPQTWRDVLDTNLTGVFFCLKAAGPILCAQKTGAVLIVGSLSSVNGQPGQSAYAASKAGLLGLLKTAAKEWGRENICINALFPGWHQSRLSEETFPNSEELQNHVLHRTPNLSKVAEMAYHIANLSDTSGQIFNLDSRIS
ncbi:MAG: SDR family NAD(P)-dependent oxidoreductase [Nitrospirales bacterium]|nr:SDR family NAD(P)-dependent oxidoreductase [Nitrospirales bacterium]